MHTHRPATHCRPAPQGASVPHMHEPAVQRSAVNESHAVQVIVVGEPQCWKLVCVVSQVEPDVQQPPQPLEASHTQVAALPLPPVQVVPAGQAAPVEPQTQLLLVVSQRLVDVVAQVVQALPTVPHCVSVSGETQFEPAQQPLGHKVALQPLHTPSVVPPQLPPAPHEVQVEPL